MPHVCLTYASKNYEMRKKTELPKKGDNGSPEKTVNMRGVEKGMSPLPLL